MSIEQSNFQWETLLDDAEWDRAESLEQLLPTRTSHEPDTSGPCAHRSGARSVVLALSGVLACALVLWLAAQHGVSAIDAELHDVVEVENWLQRSDHITATASLVDADADPAWQTAPPARAGAGERERAARAAAAGAGGAHAPALRPGHGAGHRHATKTAKPTARSRFYRETPAGWQRTSPDDAFWGREQMLETDHFRIRYRQADAQAVIAAAPKLDAYLRAVACRPGPDRRPAPPDRGRRPGDDGIAGIPPLPRRSASPCRRPCCCTRLWT